MVDGAVHEANLVALETAIESRDSGTSAPVRRSFARMRTEDPVAGDEPAPVVSEKPTRRFARPRTGG